MRLGRGEVEGERGGGGGGGEGGGGGGACCYVLIAPLHGVQLYTVIQSANIHSWGVCGVFFVRTDLVLGLELV